MQPSTIAVILAVGCMECMAYAAVDEVLALLLASLSAQHPGYALLLKCLRWLLQALFYALLGWQGMSMLLLGLNYTDAARGAALVAAVDSAAATPRRKRREGARAGAAEPPSPSGAGAGFAAAPPTALVPAAAAAASAAAATAASAAAASPAHAYAEQRRALALRERLAAASPEGETLRFAPCTRDLDAPWAEVLAAQLRNACIRPLVPGDVGAREADPDAPPGVRAFKRRRSVQLVVAEHLTPELRQGVAFVSSVASVPAIVKLIETTWEVPDAQWACVLRELCPTDKVSLGWARHRECCVYEVHPTDPSLTRWTGYLDVRILHSRWMSSITQMIIDKAVKHFKGKTLESLGHDGSETGFCAKDVFRRICTPYVEPEAEAVAEAQ